MQNSDPLHPSKERNYVELHLDCRTDGIRAVACCPRTVAGQTNKGSHTASSRGSAQVGSQASSENCGAPDEPKSCPPMPRHPLQYYPGDKSTKGP